MVISRSTIALFRSEGSFCILVTVFNPFLLVHAKIFKRRLSEMHSYVQQWLSDLL